MYYDIDDDDNNNKRKYCYRIIHTILLSLSTIGFIGFAYGSIMYSIIQNDNETDKMKTYLLIYTLAQGVCTFFACYNICASIVWYCYFCYHGKKREWNLELIYSSLPIIIFSFLIILAYGIGYIFAGLISYEFFAYNCTTTYTFFVPMLIFVIFLLVMHGISLLSLVVFLIILVCVIWPLTVYVSCRNRNRNLNSSWDAPIRGPM